MCVYDIFTLVRIKMKKNIIKMQSIQKLYISVLIFFLIKTYLDLYVRSYNFDEIYFQ